MDNNGCNQKNPGYGVMLALLTCSMLILMGGAAVTPGLPGMETRFSDTPDLVSFIITLPHLAVAIVGFAMGALSDRMGKVRTLVMSLVIFIITGTGSFFLDNIYAILVLRFLLGFGLAGIVCSVTSLISSYYSGRQRIKMLGLQSASMGIGVLILEVIGGSLADMGWNSPFLVYLIAVPFLILVLLFLREPERSNDVRQVAASDEGTVDRKTLVAAYLAIFVGMIIIFTVPTKMPTYMETSLGVSATLMGLFLGFHGLGNAFFSFMHRRFSMTYSSIQLIIIAFIILAFALSMPKVLGGNVVVCVLAMIIAGFSVGLLVPSVVSCVVGASTDANRGKMMGIYAIFLNLGQFAVSIVTIPVLSAVNNNYPDMFLVFAIIALVIGLIIAFQFGIKKTRRVY